MCLWMPGHIPVVSLGGDGSLLDIEQMSANAHIDQKPRDSSVEGLQVTADMLMDDQISLPIQGPDEI